MLGTGILKIDAQMAEMMKMFFFNEGFPYWCAFAHKKQVNMVIGQNTCNSVISHHRDHQWLKVNCKSHSFRGMRTNKKSYPS